jgi:hypothetical protein
VFHCPATFIAIRKGNYTKRYKTNAYNMVFHIKGRKYAWEGGDGWNIWTLEGTIIEGRINFNSVELHYACSSLNSIRAMR